MDMTKEVLAKIFGAAGCVELSIGDIESLYSEGRRLASAVGRGNGRNRLKRARQMPSTRLVEDGWTAAVA